MLQRASTLTRPLLESRDARWRWLVPALRMEIDVDSGFKSAMRSTLDFIGGALRWMGLMAICPPLGMSANVAADSDQLSMTPLSRAERAEWAALVERVR